MNKTVTHTDQSHKIGPKSKDWGKNQGSPGLYLVAFLRERWAHPVILKQKLVWSSSISTGLSADTVCPSHCQAVHPPCCCFFPLGLCRYLALLVGASMTFKHLYYTNEPLNLVNCCHVVSFSQFHIVSLSLFSPVLLVAFPVLFAVHPFLSIVSPILPDVSPSLLGVFHISCHVLAKIPISNRVHEVLCCLLNFAVHRHLAIMFQADILSWLASIFADADVTHHHHQSRNP